MTGLPIHVRRGLLAAIAVCAFVVVVELLLAPVYRRGTGQPVISHLNGAASLLALPGFVVAVVVGLRTGHHTTAAAWVAVLVLNFGLYAVGVSVLSGMLGAGRAWRGRRGDARPAKTEDPLPGALPAHREREDAVPAPRVVSRRHLLGAAVGTLAAGSVAWPVGVATRRYDVTRLSFPVTGLPAPLDGLRIVQLTDIHHGPWVPLAHVRAVVAAANALEPDLVLLTGDYVHRSVDFIDPVVDALANLRATVGVLGVLGNHDWWESGPATKRAFTRANIPLIDNARRFVTPNRTLTRTVVDDGLCVAGVGDLYEDDQDYDAALGNGVPPDVPRLLLSHNPDVAEDRAFRRSGLRVDLMISGHTHGGQVRLPGVGAPFVPSRYGQKYAQGLVQGPACPVFISRGIGVTVLPVRAGATPEIAVIELRRA